MACDPPAPVLESEGLSGLKTEAPKRYKLPQAGIQNELLSGYVPFVPPAFHAQGKTQLSYELQIENNSRHPFRLDLIEVLNPADDGKPLFSFDSTYLKQHLQRPGLSDPETQRTIGASAYAIANLWLKMEQEQPRPQQVFHRMYYSLERPDGGRKTFVYDVGLIDIPATTTRTLPLPFRTGTWFYEGSGHRDSRYLTGGKPSYPQRHALDWVALEADGTFLRGDRSLNESHVSYGIEILAVADGTVFEVRDSIPENVPESEELAVKLSRQNVMGNSVVLDIAGAARVVYAHFIPGSIRVQPGDKVKEGDVLGLLGNSGNSTGPHLHIHLETQSPATLGGEGIPYHLPPFEQLATYVDSDWPMLDSIFAGSVFPFADEALRSSEAELPVDIGIVRFKEK